MIAKRPTADAGAEEFALQPAPKIFVAGHRGMVGSSLICSYQPRETSGRGKLRLPCEFRK